MAKWWSGGHWVTLEDGQHVLIDDDGRIKAGLGPQNNGKTFAELNNNNQSNDMSKLPFGGKDISVQTNPDKNMSRVVSNLRNNFSNVNPNVYTFGTGAMARDEIAFDTVNKTLSGGRTETVDTSIRFANPRKVTGTVKVSKSERIGMGGGDSDYSRSAYGIDFHNYQELQDTISKLLKTELSS